MWGPGGEGAGLTQTRILTCAPACAPVCSACTQAGIQADEAAHPSGSGELGAGMQVVVQVRHGLGGGTDDGSPVWLVRGHLCGW